MGCARSRWTLLDACQKSRLRRGIVLRPLQSRVMEAYPQRELRRSALFRRLHACHILDFPAGIETGKERFSIWNGRNGLEPARRPRLESAAQESSLAAVISISRSSHRSFFRLGRADGFS